MNETVKDVVANVASLVNVYRAEDQRPWTDTELMGPIKLAYREVVLKLAERGHNHQRAEIDFLDIAAGIGVLTWTPAGGGTPPAGTLYVLPAWFVEPIRAWERTSSGSNWMPMTQVLDHLPMNAAPTSAIGWWEFRDKAIRFRPAESSVDLRFHAWTRLSELTWPTDQIGLPDLVNPIAYAAAAIALGGNAFLEGKASEALHGLANLDAHMKQAQPIRRRRFRKGIKVGRY